MQKKHWQILDLIRTIGILQVILFHVLFGIFSYGGSDAALELIARTPSWMTFAWQPVGVDAIFLVSSFLLTSALLEERQRFGFIKLRSYIIKRLSRILPLYYLALVLFQLGTTFDPLQFSLSAVFLGVTLGAGNVIPVGWSMEVMMLFYLIMPILLTLLLKCAQPLLILGIAVIVVICSRITYLHISEISAGRIFLDTYQGLPTSNAAQQLYYHPWFRLPPFLIGMGLAIMAHRTSNETPKRTHYWLGYLGFIIVIFSCFSPVQVEESWVYELPEVILTVYFGASTSLFSAGLSMLMWKFLVLDTEFMRPISDFCTLVSNCIFGIYLFHMPFLVLAAVLVMQSTEKAQLLDISLLEIWTIFIFTTAFSVAFAKLLLRFIELPITSRIRRMLT